MHWYGGSIAEAVTLSKQKNAIFVVFVEGENDLSREMSQTIDDNAVVSRLGNQDNFLAVKLKSGSTNYTHFAQIYQFVPVPSLFFIGRNGTPLEVICAGVQANNLATRIDRILEEHYKEKPAHVQPSTSSQNLKEQTANLLKAEASGPPTQVQQAEDHQKPETSSGPAAKVPRLEPETDVKMEATPDEEYEVVCSGDVCVRRPKTEQAGPSTSKEPVPDNTVPVINQAEPQAPTEEESSLSIEQKLEKAKELIEARRREKADKEKELEKQKEMERRSAGKGVAELKKWQAEQEFKQIQEERKREKMENNLARQRILEQIAQDRAERRARDSAPAHPSPTPPPPASDGSTGARIQFKLPDGTSHTAHFEADGTLGDVQRYIAQNLQLSASSFSLWTAFPRRELREPSATLRGLQLAPSAALLVLPTRSPAPVATPSTFATLITFITQLFTSIILEPSQQLYQWVRTRLFSPAAPRSPSPSPSPRSQPPPPPSSGPRRRGNIHRLSGDTGGDDDNNTWNGNSTQQM